MSNDPVLNDFPKLEKSFKIIFRYFRGQKFHVGTNRAALDCF